MAGSSSITPLSKNVLGVLACALYECKHTGGKADAVAPDLRTNNGPQSTEASNSMLLHIQEELVAVRSLLERVTASKRAKLGPAPEHPHPLAKQGDLRQATSVTRLLPAKSSNDRAIGQESTVAASTSNGLEDLL
jgi:hypothetical protein